MGLRGLPAPAPQGNVIDDADCVADEAALFHLINLCAERGESLLLIGREAPARWPVRLPDLASRLRATQSVGVGPASDALLRALLSKFFADRQLRVEPDVQAWLLTRLPRDAASLAEAVARLDRAALGMGGRITRPLARLALNGWLAEQGVCEDSETERRLPSPSLAPLL
jgi:chromosomal replication initiation ATPase DnaA